MHIVWTWLLKTQLSKCLVTLNLQSCEVFSCLTEPWHHRGCWGRSAQEFVPSLSRGSLKGKFFNTAIPRQRWGKLRQEAWTTTLGIVLGFSPSHLNCRQDFLALVCTVPPPAPSRWKIVTISWCLHLPSFISLQSYHAYFCIAEYKRLYWIYFFRMKVLQPESALPNLFDSTVISQSRVWPRADINIGGQASIGTLLNSWRISHVEVNCPEDSGFLQFFIFSLFFCI